MLRKIMTVAMPVAALAAVFTFFPATTAQAYPASCDSTYWTCMYSATSIDGLGKCVLAFYACSGGANPPPPSSRVAARQH